MCLRPSFLFFVVAGSLVAGGSFSGDRYDWAQLQAGYLKQENSPCVKDATAWGLGGGRWFAPRWGWEAAVLSGRLEDTARLWKAQETHLDATLLHSPLGLLGSWRPFVRGGLGVSQLESPASLSGGTTRRLNLLGGIGTQYLVGSSALATLEARYVNVQTSQARSEFEFLAGFGVRWGGRPAPRLAASPAPAPPVQTPMPAAPAPVSPPPPPVEASIPVPEPPVPAVLIPDASPVPVEAPPPPRTIVLSEAILHFANNGPDPAPQAAAAIQEVANQLNAYGSAYTLLVSGHTSNVGRRSHNQALSKRRAEAVARLLVAAGIPADRISAVGRGSDVPIADNQTPGGQSRNRRVEIEVKAGDASVQKTRTETALVEAPAPVKPRSKPNPTPKAKGHVKK